MAKSLEMRREHKNILIFMLFFALLYFHAQTNVIGTLA